MANGPRSVKMSSLADLDHPSWKLLGFKTAHFTHHITTGLLAMGWHGIMYYFNRMKAAAIKTMSTIERRSRFPGILSTEDNQIRSRFGVKTLQIPIETPKTSIMLGRMILQQTEWGSVIFTVGQHCSMMGAEVETAQATSPRPTQTILACSNASGGSLLMELQWDCSASAQGCSRGTRSNSGLVGIGS